ncbi:MAG: trimethylamine methyltransferase family protein [bacterium]|nr:trimethylamine methyltransferase family protein [bacterium]
MSRLHPRRSVRPIRPRLSLDILTGKDVQAIHEAALRVLSETGVRFPSDRALGILADAGCEVDHGRQVARIPPDVAMAAIGRAPRRFALGARDPADTLDLDGEHCYLSTDGCGIEVYDLETGERRRSTRDDVYRSAVVADYLDAIAFYWGPTVSAQDVPPSTRPLHELEAAFLGTSKHVQPETILSAPVARWCVEMALAEVGTTAELRRRPIFSVMQCAVDPLGQDGGSLEASLVAAAHGIPTGFMPMPMSCATAPATVAGNLVVTTVDALAPLILIQLAHPGAPVFFAAAPTVMDLRTGGYTGGSPEDYLLGGAFNQICRFYGLPLSMGAMATGAKRPDWQAALDNSFSTLLPVLTGTAMLTGAGMLNGSKILSYQQLVMDSEIYSVVAKVAEGIRVDAETLAVETIQRVGPEGNYLAQPHTLRHLGDIWRPTVVDRSPYEAWEQGGGRGAYDVAADLARDILAGHRPREVEPAVRREWQRILAAAGRELEATG